MPMMPFIGVRISWLTFARNALFARLAACAASDAGSAHRARRAPPSRPACEPDMLRTLPSATRSGVPRTRNQRYAPAFVPQAHFAVDRQSLLQTLQQRLHRQPRRSSGCMRVAQHVQVSASSPASYPSSSCMRGESHIVPFAMSASHRPSCVPWIARSKRAPALRERVLGGLLLLDVVDRAGHADERCPAHRARATAQAEPAVSALLHRDAQLNIVNGDCSVQCAARWLPAPAIRSSG